MPNDLQMDHVLVVEDDSRVRRLTARRLTNLGYKVMEAADAAGIRLLMLDEPDYRDGLTATLEETSIDFGHPVRRLKVGPQKGSIQ